MASNKTKNRLKAILLERQLSSKWVADQLGKNFSTVSRWCANKTQPPFEILAEIADILEMDVEDFIVPDKSQSNK